jgi:hypothetical protein
MISSGNAYGHLPITTQVGAITPAPVVLANGATHTSDVIVSDGLPQINLWIRQTVGVGGVDVAVEFLFRPTEWEPFSPPVPILPDVATLLHFTLGQAYARLKIVNNSGGSVTVKYRLTATVPGS